MACQTGLIVLSRPALAAIRLAASGLRKLVKQNRRFNVFISSETGELTAGVRTRICTVHVELKEGQRWDGSQENLPEVNCQLIRLPHVSDNLEVTEWQLDNVGRPEKAVYLTSNIASGPFTFNIVILNKRLRNVFFYGGSLSHNRNSSIFSGSYSVLPSTPENITLRSVLSDQVDKTIFYRGGTATVVVETRDAFGNLSGDNALLCNFIVNSVKSSKSVKLLSRGLFEFKLKCHKIGLLNTKIESEQTQSLEFAFEVKYPPASARHSNIVAEDLDSLINTTFEAGTEVNFRVNVRDIYGNPILKEERQVNIMARLDNMSLDCSQDNASEMSSIKCKARENSSIYDVTIVLQRAGIRKLQLFFTDTKCTVPEMLSVTLKVNPSRMSEVHVETLTSSIFVNVPQRLKVKAFDNFGNSILFHDNVRQFEIETTTKKDSNTGSKSESKLQVEAQDGSGSCSVTFTSAGYHNLHVSLRESTSDYELFFTDSITVFVTLAPFSHTKSFVKLSRSILRVKSGEEARFAVQVYDVYSNPISHGDLQSLNKKLPLVATFVAKQNEKFVDLSSKENRSISITPVAETGVYEVRYTPLTAGRRILRILLEGKLISQAPVEVYVNPSILSKVDVEIRSRTSNVFVKVPQKVKVKAFDNFGNSILFHDNVRQFEIETTTKKKDSSVQSKSKSKLQVEAQDGSGSCSVTFTSAGYHHLHVSLRESTSDYELLVTESITVFVTLAPFSHTKSVVKLLRSILQVKAGEEALVVAKVYDVFGNLVSYRDLQILHQKIPLVATFVAKETEKFDFSSKENESICVNPVAETGVYEVRCTPLIVGKRTLRILLDDKLISEAPVEVYVSPSCLSKVQSKFEIKDSEIFVNVPQTLKIKAFDAFGNIITFNDTRRQLDFFSNVRSVNANNKLQVGGVDGNASCTVTFVSAGQHCVKLLLRDSTSNLTVTDSISVYAKHPNLNLKGIPDNLRVEEFDDEHYCQMSYYRDSNSDRYTTITCHEVNKGEIIGPDHARLHNINRVLGGEILEDDDIEKDGVLRATIVRVEDLFAEQVLQIHGLLLACLRGRHYRQEAKKFDAKRQEWKMKSQRAFEEGNGREAQRCSRIKGEYSHLVTICNGMARDEICSMYNEGRGLSEIDLHELYVADESKLKDFYKQLLKRRDETEAMKIVSEARAEQDEAIEKLRERLQQVKGANEKPQWLEVIVGAGHHSRGKQKIKPKVKDFLKREKKKRNIPETKEVNEGSLLITFEPYSGHQPCFGYYYCTECKKSWCSKYSWVGKYQCCYRCHQSNRISKCYPMKQGELRRDGYRRPNPSGSSKPADRHYQALCEMCQEFGEYCGD